MPSNGFGEMPLWFGLSENREKPPALTQTLNLPYYTPVVKEKSRPSVSAFLRVGIAWQLVEGVDLEKSIISGILSVL